MVMMMMEVIISVADSFSCLPNNYLGRLPWVYLREIKLSPKGDKMPAKELKLLADFSV